VHAFLTLACGLIVGLSLGVIGGGGSILGVPLLMYVVGVADPHVAIGTSAFAVGVNALANLLGHWRRGNVKWPCAAAFAVAGVVGTVAGSHLGKNFDGQKLLFLFAFVMAAVGIAMLRPRASAGDTSVHINPVIAIRLLSVGLVTGLIAGFFGIGGGFLIVPGIMLGSGMPILNAVGSSLFSVSAFGFTTAASYAPDCGRHHRRHTRYQHLVPAGRETSPAGAGLRGGCTRGCGVRGDPGRNVAARINSRGSR
jgi:uncharacterized protein